MGDMKNLFFALIFLIAGVANAQKTPQTAPADVVNSAMDSEEFYRLLIGELAYVDGAPGEAFNIYLEQARKTPSNQLFERAMRIALDARDVNAATKLAKEWAYRIPESAQAQNYTFQLLFGAKQYAQGMVSLQAFLKLSKEADRPSIILGLNRFFSDTQNKQAPSTDLIRLLRPYAEQANTFENHATRAAARLAIARADVETERFNDALAELHVLTRESPDSIDGWLLQGALQLQENQFPASEKSFQQFLVLAQKANLPTDHAGYVQAYLGLAQLAENRKDYDAAQNWLSKIEDDKERLAAQLRRASILAKQGKLAEAKQLIEQLPEPTQAQARAKLMAEVELMRDNGATLDAIALMDKSLASDPKDIDLLYEQSTLYEKIKNYDKMESLLKQILALDANNAMAYNALGYSLADRGLRLEEAKGYIERALSITPNDPYIVDSLGWTLYRMGQLDEALKTLQSAYKIRADVEIGTHIGEVFWQMGRKDDALKTWRAAQSINPDNEALKETLKRLGATL